MLKLGLPTDWAIKSMFDRVKIMDHPLVTNKVERFVPPRRRCPDVPICLQT